MINQTSFSTEHDIPTSWSADLREGLAMMEIDYKQFSDEQLPSIYSLFNVLSYPSICSVRPPFIPRKQPMCTCATPKSSRSSFRGRDWSKN